MIVFDTTVYKKYNSKKGCPVYDIKLHLIISTC